MKDLLEIILASIPVIISVVPFFYRRAKEKIIQKNEAYEACIKFRNDVVVPYAKLSMEETVLVGNNLTSVLDNMNVFAKSVLALNKELRWNVYDMQGARFCKLFRDYDTIIRLKYTDYNAMITLFEEWNKKNVSIANIICNLLNIKQ